MTGIVERLQARSAWWGRLLDYVIAHRDKAKGYKNFTPLNGVAHGIRGRDPVEEAAAAAISRLVQACKPALSKSARAVLQETAEAERAAGDPAVAAAIEFLLELEDRRRVILDEIEATL